MFEIRPICCLVFMLLLSSCLLFERCNAFQFATSTSSTSGPYSTTRRLHTKGLFLSGQQPINKESDEDEFTTLRNRFATELLDAAAQVGQVGKWASIENRQRMDELAEQLRPYSDSKPARVPLRGTHHLVYSGSDSGPTAGLVGPFVGRVTQVFWNQTIYQNRVQWGPLMVSIYGERHIVEDETSRVKFYQTQIHLGGKQLFQKDININAKSSRGGNWDHIFTGMIQYQQKKLLLRCMNTPKLFILIQQLNGDGTEKLQ